MPLTNSCHGSQFPNRHSTTGRSVCGLSLRNVLSNGVEANRPPVSSVSKPSDTAARMTRWVVSGALPSRAANSAAVRLPFAMWSAIERSATANTVRHAQ
jgi:hypothetical protein